MRTGIPTGTAADTLLHAFEGPGSRDKRNLCHPRPLAEASRASSENAAWLHRTLSGQVFNVGKDRSLQLFTGFPTYHIHTFEIDKFIKVLLSTTYVCPIHVHSQLSTMFFSSSIFPALFFRCT